MKKGYYIHSQGRDSIGISKKIDMQIKEFQKYCNMQELEIKVPHRSLLERLLGLLPVCSIRRDYESVLSRLDDPAFVYIRRFAADRSYVSFLKQIKQRFPNCKIVIEIFSYPYDKDDFGKWNAWPFYFKELIYRKKLKNYVDRFVTYTADKVIFGVPTICTANGIDVDGAEAVKGEYREKVITLIGVAYMQKHHGYERIIEGLHKYYQSKNKDCGYTVYLLLIGDGPEKEKYQKLVERYSLQQWVEFYPPMSGVKLDQLYDRSDIALASFGFYKIKFYGKSSALKTRECLAKGMPMLAGSEIDVLDDSFKYIKKFPNSPQPVCVSEIIDFYENITSDGSTKQEIAYKIKNYAKSHIDMSVAMKPIIDYIESGE